MISAAHIGASVEVEVDEDEDGIDFDPDEVPDNDPKTREPPFIVGFHKIDFNDDDAVAAMITDIGEQYEIAVKKAGLKMAPRGTAYRVSRGGVPMNERIMKDKK